MRCMESGTSERVIQSRLEQAKETLEDDDEAHRKIANLERDLADLQALSGLALSLLHLAPAEQDSPTAIVDKGLEFLESYARDINKLDHFAVEKLSSELRDMRHWLTYTDSPATVDLWKWLEELPRESMIMGSGPQPGKIHVDNIHNGGHTGRPYTFIVGLDDSRFPGAGIQDPLLLDGERRAISDDLPTAAGRLQESTIPLHHGRVESLVELSKIRAPGGTRTHVAALRVRNPRRWTTSAFRSVGSEGLEPSPTWLRARHAAASTLIPCLVVLVFCADSARRESNPRPGPYKRPALNR